MGHVTFLFWFLTVHAIIIARKAMSSALGGKTERSSSGSNFRKLYVKKHFLARKKSRTVTRTVTRPVKKS
jgi:hypothetical protein